MLFTWIVTFPLFLFSVIGLCVSLVFGLSSEDRAHIRGLLFQSSAPSANDPLSPFSPIKVYQPLENLKDTLGPDIHVVSLDSSALDSNKDQQASMSLMPESFSPLTPALEPNGHGHV